MRDTCGLLIAGQGAARGDRRATGDEQVRARPRRETCFLSALLEPVGGQPGVRRSARVPLPRCARVLVGFSRYCWTRSTIGMIVGGCASSMPSSSMTGPRYVRNSSNASSLSQTSKT